MLSFSENALKTCIAVQNIQEPYKTNVFIKLSDTFNIFAVFLVSMVVLLTKDAQNEENLPKTYIPLWGQRHIYATFSRGTGTFSLILKKTDVHTIKQQVKLYKKNKQPNKNNEYWISEVNLQYLRR